MEFLSLQNFRKSEARLWNLIMTIGSTKRQTFRFGENFPLELSRNIRSSFVLWHRKKARKKGPFIPGIAPDTLRFARYIILKIRPRVSAWVLHEAWTRKLKSFFIVHVTLLHAP